MRARVDESHATAFQGKVCIYCTYYHVKLQSYSIQMIAKVKTGGRVTTKEDIILFNKLQLSGEGLTVMLSGHGLAT